MVEAVLKARKDDVVKVDNDLEHTKERVYARLVQHILQPQRFDEILYRKMETNCKSGTRKTTEVHPKLFEGS